MGNRAEVVVRNEAGDLEIIDLTTGEVVANNHGAITPTSDYAFSYPKALMICQMVKEGKTMAEITSSPDMPPLHVISHWQRSDRMFAEEMKLARKERGEVYHDRAMAIANAAAEGKLHKDDVPAMALAVKTYQWGAEKAKPESYGNKVTHEGSTEKPILMRVINTGISRGPANSPIHKPDVQVVEVIETKEEVTHVNAIEEAREDDKAHQSENPKRRRGPDVRSDRSTSRGRKTGVQSKDG